MAVAAWRVWRAAGFAGTGSALALVALQLAQRAVVHGGSASRCSTSACWGDALPARPSPSGASSGSPAHYLAWLTVADLASEPSRPIRAPCAPRADGPPTPKRDRRCACCRQASFAMLGPAF